MTLPIDRTNLTAAQSNQVPSQLIQSAKNIAALQTPYDTIDELYNYVLGLIAGGVLQPYPAFFSRQALINGGFAVNQRVVSGTVTLAAGAYGHDRWKAGAAGCTYTFVTSANVTTITITAGSLIQVIEGINLSSGTYTLSWTGTAQGKIGAGSYGASGITGTATGGTNLNIEFNIGTLSKVGFNAGAIALPFQPRSFADEEFNGLYYNQRLSASASPNRVFGVGQAISTTNANIYIKLDRKMRILPTLSNGGAFALSDSGGGSRAITSFSVATGLSSPSNLVLSCNVASGLTAGSATYLLANNDATAYLNFDAEL